ncbi:MAG: hypothetical protein AMJ62_07240 [Myxococcales bacterium SG8_38]|nr:MAG: hypothetical protein AMJ62_07240 [Myxococcales bacterium SG8_38]
MTYQLAKLALVAFVLTLTLAGCKRGASDDSGEAPTTGSIETADSAEPATPEVIDADWVASKFQAPPPPETKDWAREIEMDPIAALKQMDPGALQPKRDVSPPGPRADDPSVASTVASSAPREKRAAAYNPDAPLRGWPPAVGQLYPNIVLKDQTGQVTALGDFLGKVVLIEVVGLTCRACHAFSGGNEPGKPRFRGIAPQPNLSSIERYVNGYAKLSLDHPDIVFVQLVLYGMDGQSPPREEDVRAWAQHFGFDRAKNQVVLVGDQRFISPETRRLIPGFHLIDRNGILRAMSSNDPRHDPLHSSLLPKLGELVNGGG